MEIFHDLLEHTVVNILDFSLIMIRVSALVAETSHRRRMGTLGNFSLLSSDSAFLDEPSMPGGHFEQRTLTTRYLKQNRLFSSKK